MKLEQEYRAAGYTDHFNAVDSVTVAESRCPSCGRPTLDYIGLKAPESYVAIMACRTCGREEEF